MFSESMEIVTIEKSELLELIEATVEKAVASALSSPRDEIMTLDETAAYLKRSRSTITRLKKQGLPHRDNRFRRSEVDAWWISNGGF